jgi:hypothetical protein
LEAEAAKQVFWRNSSNQLPRSSEMLKLKAPMPRPGLKLLRRFCMVKRDIDLLSLLGTESCCRHVATGLSEEHQAPGGGSSAKFSV